MSTATVAATSSISGSGFFLQNFGNLGLDLSIDLVLAFLVLLSTVLRAPYICCRARRNSINPSSYPNDPSNTNDTIVLTRTIFISEVGNEEQSNVVGLDQNVINSNPKFEFSISKDQSTSDTVCLICLCDYKDNETLRMMPDCRHFFHLVYVDPWLKLNTSCPICRTSPVSMPLSTPLSELVPFSQYPVIGRR